MPTQFRDRITVDGTSGFKAEAGRYHLYISLGCPWAHRTALLWNLKGLETVIGLSIVDPVTSEQGWTFSDNPGCIRADLYHANYLWQIYVKANPTYTGRVTVPVLWDQHTSAIVNNESRQIIGMLNSDSSVRGVGRSAESTTLSLWGSNHPGRLVYVYNAISV